MQANRQSRPLAACWRPPRRLCNSEEQSEKSSFSDKLGTGSIRKLNIRESHCGHMCDRCARKLDDRAEHPPGTCWRWIDLQRRTSICAILRNQLYPALNVNGTYGWQEENHSFQPVPRRPQNGVPTRIIRLGPCSAGAARECFARTITKSRKGRQNNRLSWGTPVGTGHHYASG